MGVVRVTVVSAVTILCSLALTSHPAAAEPYPPRLNLSLELDRDMYVEGDPVYALTCVRNQDNVSFRDLADMDPARSHLILDIKSGKNRFEMRYDDLVIYSGEGPELEAGGCACEVLNLAERYGHSLNGKGEPRLPPGEYRVSARLLARLGFARLPEVEVKSDTVTFRVAPHTTQAGNLARDSLLQGTEEQISTARMLGIAQSAGRSPVHTAYQIDNRVRLRPIRDAEKRKWIAELKALAQSDEVRCVLDTMDRQIRYKRFYTSYGP